MRGTASIVIDVTGLTEADVKGALADKVRRLGFPPGSETRFGPPLPPNSRPKRKEFRERLVKVLTPGEFLNWLRTPNIPKKMKRTRWANRQHRSRIRRIDALGLFERIATELELGPEGHSLVLRVALGELNSPAISAALLKALDQLEGDAMRAHIAIDLMKEDADLERRGLVEFV